MWTAPLKAGRYRAVVRTQVSCFHGSQHLNWCVYEPGEEFEVPELINNFRMCLVWFPDFGQKEPPIDMLLS